MQSLFLELDDEQFEKNILNQSGDDTIKSVWISNNLEKFEIIIQKINVSNEDSEYSNDYSKAISLLELLPKNLLNKISLKTFSKFHYFVFRFDEDTLKLIDENKLSQIVKTIPKEKIEKEINSDSYKTLQFKRDAINYIRDIYNKTFPNNKITIGESELIEPELTDDFIKNIYLRAKAKRVYHPKVFDMIVNHTIPAYTNQNQINSLEPYLNNTISKLEILKPEQYSSVPEYSNSFDGWSLQDLEALYKILFNKDLPGS